VNDLATAHVQAMNHISKTKEDIVVNLATGDGHSVLDVIHKTIEVSGNDIPYDIVGRRTGDPGTVLSVSKKAFALLNWSPGHSDLDTLIRSAWEVYR
jgi:UDP-glucose 4-epimerase